MRLLIINNNMHIGGVQKALINLLVAIHNEYDITLLLFWPEGEYMKDIPDNVKVISPKSGYRYLGMTKHDAKGHWFRFLIRSYYAAITRLFGRKKAITLMSLGQKPILGYDVGISYLHNGPKSMFYGGCNDFLLKHVKTDKKVAFLHCDYERCGANTKENNEQYAQFDIIAACSDGCRRVFTNALPELEEKTITVQNCHDFERIDLDAERVSTDLISDHIHIVTVARLGKEKGVPRAVQAIAKLGPLRSKIKYYIIGDGIQRKEIEAMVAESQLEDTVVLLGELNNPYGYMKAADLLLIPSYSEAAPLVIGEAASLGTPVLSTATSSAKEMIVETNIGWVCENSVKGITDALRNLLKDEKSLFEKKRYLETHTQNNRISISQFATLIQRTSQ